MAKSDLDNPQYAAFAWGRFKRLMLWMVGVAAIATVIGLLVLRAMVGPIPVHMAIATGLGVFFSVLLAASLMGLVFLSAGSGHDDTVADLFEDTKP